jgi:O-antigen/teichoic acid export membrane protein
MSSSKLVARNLLSLTIAEFSSRILSVVYSIYLARVLSVVGFGLFGASKYFVLFFLPIASLGLDAIGTREIAKDKSKINFIVNNILTIRIIFGIIIYIFLILITLNLNKPVLEKILILIFGINILTANTLLNWVFQGVERLNVYAWRTIIANVMNFFGIIIFVHSPDDLLIAAIVVSTTLIINTLWMFALYIKDYGLFKFEFNFDLWKDYLKAGLPIALTFFIIGIYNNEGIVLLNFLSNNYETGIFSAAFNVLAVSVLLSSILQTVYYPVFSKTTDYDERKNVIKQYTRLTFTIGTYLPLFLIIFADKVALLFGKDYSASIIPMRILQLSCLFIYYNITLFSPLIAWKYENKVVFSNALGLVAATLASFLLIPKLGATGAAIATLIGELAVFVVLVYIFFPIFRTIFLKEYIFIFLISLISTLPFMFIEVNKYLSILLMFLSFGMFIALNLYLKTFSISELKKLLKR